MNMKHHKTLLNMFRSSTQLILFFTFVSAAKNKTEEVQAPFIIQEFFDFQKEVEDFIPSVKDPIVSTTTTIPSSPTEDSLYLEHEILAERDYDFYEDEPVEVTEDNDTAGSSQVSVRAGFYPQNANRRDSDYYDYEVEERDYGHSSHSSGSYSDHGASYGGGHDSGYKVQPRKPGPYGYATPNFKCEKSSETLYVTETEWTFDKKCFNVYKVQCTEGYGEGKVGFCSLF